MKDKKYRSLLKAFSWRVTATCTTIIISLIITGHVGTALKIGGCEVIVKIILYYFHERFWFMLGVGMSKPRKENEQVQLNEAVKS